MNTYIARLHVNSDLNTLLNLTDCIQLPAFDDCRVFVCNDAWLDSESRELLEEHDYGVADLMQALDVQIIREELITSIQAYIGESE